MLVHVSVPLGSMFFVLLKKKKKTSSSHIFAGAKHVGSMISQRLTTRFASKENASMMISVLY